MDRTRVGQAFSCYGRGDSVGLASLCIHVRPRRTGPKSMEALSLQQVQSDDGDRSERAITKDSQMNDEPVRPPHQVSLRTRSLGRQSLLLESSCNVKVESIRGPRETGR